VLDVSSDDFVILLDDEPDSGGADVAGYWKVVVIDDDPAVHDGTRFALSNYTLNGFGLDIISAYSASEGREVLAEHPDTAVVLLDVVMETDTAGLDLVGYLREQLGNETVRIILRTGQPGQAPERRVIVDFDINDYKAKTELTADKLFTAMTSALRSYEQLRRLDDTRRGLETIVMAAGSLYDFQPVERLAGAMLGHLDTLVGPGLHGMVVRREDDERGYSRLSGCGRHAHKEGADLDGAHPGGICPDGGGLDEALRRRIETVFFSGCPDHAETGMVLPISTRSAGRLVVAIDTNRPLTDIDRSLIDVFCSRLPAAFDNILLYEALQTANVHLEERVAERTKELDRANAFKKEVLGIVAHDLKNPLSVILGRADMLGSQMKRDSVDVEKAIKHADEIARSARRMTGMIESLLAEAMSDAVDITLRRGTLDLAELIVSVAESNQPLAEGKNQSISIVAPRPVVVRADYDRLREAIDNLVSNAVKYSPTGGEIGISTQARDGEAVVRVSDTGPGLSDDDMERLFGRFQRLSARPTGGESSSGLGLSIAKRIVELHGGRIWAERDSGRGGTSFGIALPLDDAAR